MATDPTRSDADIQREVALALASDPGLDLVDPDVTVQDGVVSLRGLVGGVGHRDRAGVVAAAVAGVRSVDNQIELAAAPAGRDPELAGRVDEALVAEPALAGTTLRAIVHYGVVHLAGVVASATQHDAAEAAVRAVAGVQDVRNDLQIASSLQRPDPDIEGEVRVALLDRLLVGRSELDVEVHEGVVHLAGSVDDPRLRDWAEEIVRAIPGVQGVDNQVQAS